MDGVNILVNNAGVSCRAVVEHMNVKEEQHQFETNYFGPVGLIRAVLPHIRKSSFLNDQYSKMSGPEHGTEGLYADYYQHMSQFIERQMKYSLTTPEAVARRILHTIQIRNPPLWIPATFDAKVFYYLRRLVRRKILLELLFATVPRVRIWAKTYTNR